MLAVGDELEPAILAHTITATTCGSRWVHRPNRHVGVHVEEVHTPSARRGGRRRERSPTLPEPRKQAQVIAHHSYG
jgi:hypothetical protein